jgi:acyl carrier protein
LGEVRVLEQVEIDRFAKAGYFADRLGAALRANADDESLESRFINFEPMIRRSRVIAMEDIDKVVHQFILREFLPGEDPDDLTNRTPLITGGILDSISTLKLVVFLEEHFGITIEAYEAGVEHLDSIGQISSLISKKQAA